MGVKRKQEYTFICDCCGKEVVRLDDCVPSDWIVVMRGNLSTHVIGPTDQTQVWCWDELVEVREYGYEVRGPVKTLLCPDCVPHLKIWED